MPPTTPPERSEQLANVLIAVAAIGIVGFVARSPALRRIVWRVAVDELTHTLPVWFRTQVQHAWNESGQRRI